MTTAKRKVVFGGLGAIGVVLATAFVGGVTVGYLKASGAAIDLGAGGFWIALVAAILIMAGSLFAGALWMRSIDEAAREAHKAAWFWGGSGGMAVGGVLMILSGLPGAETITAESWLPGRLDPAAWMATGAFALMTLMLIGYGIVWAWWWLARR